MSWDDGYVSEFEYQRIYTREISPTALNLALLANQYPPLTKPSLRYLELGFGQGLSLNIHAATHEGEFWGNDFNPSHAITTKIMAQASGANLKVLDTSFAELAAQSDLPEFDVIVLHGIWCYVSAENHQAILNIVRSKLALGGILYISYNTTPGWAAVGPIQHLVALHSNLASPQGNNILTKMMDSLDFIQQLINTEAAYFRMTPIAVDHFTQMKKGNPSYLMHEYCNKNWAAYSFSDMAKQLTALNLTFAGDANISNLFSDMLIPPKIKNLLSDIKDPLFYQSVRDFCIHQKFRRDIWIKGGVRLTKLQQSQLLGNTRFTLTFKPISESLIASSSIGNIPIDEKIGVSIIKALAENNFAPKSINDLLTYSELSHLDSTQLYETMLMLCGRYVSPACDEETIARLAPSTDKLNTCLIHQEITSENDLFLASPVIGGGVNVPYIHHLFLLAIREGFTSVETVVDFTWRALSAKKESAEAPESVLIDGQYENRGALISRATLFFEARLPLLTALKVY